MVKLQTMQKCDNKALQIYLQEPLLLHFYRAAARQREEANSGFELAGLVVLNAFPILFYLLPYFLQAPHCICGIITVYGIIANNKSGFVESANKNLRRNDDYNQACSN